MKKSRYKEEQIIAVLKEVDGGAKLQDVIVSVRSGAVEGASDLARTLLLQPGPRIGAALLPLDRASAMETLLEG